VLVSAVAGSVAAGATTPSLTARRLRPRPRARVPSAGASVASAAGEDTAVAAAGSSTAFSVALAGALVMGVPARWAEMAETRSPLRIREPPEMPSWLASACSWASLRPARPLLLAGAAGDSAAEDDSSTAGDSSVVSVTKDPSPSTASRLGAGRDDLIWAAVQICSRIVRPCRLDFGQQGRILIHLALHPWRDAGLTLSGAV
jgi:hypothetical protein